MILLEWQRKKRTTTRTRARASAASAAAATVTEASVAGVPPGRPAPTAAMAMGRLHVGPYTR